MDPASFHVVPYVLLADLLMLLHFAFVLFVAGGAFLVLWRHRIAWLHVPCAAYGAAVELFGWVCPLTPLEIRLRRLGGQEGWDGSFIAHYLEGILYPANWTDIHVWLGVLLLVGNAVVYAWVWRRARGG